MPANSDAPTFATEAGPGAANSLYFSWDAGLVHYITLSTEMWFGTKSTDGKVNTTTMLAWLEEDLIAANKNRDTVPCTSRFDAATSDLGRHGAEVLAVFVVPPDPPLSTPPPHSLRIHSYYVLICCGARSLSRITYSGGNRVYIKKRGLVVKPFLCTCPNGVEPIAVQAIGVDSSTIWYVYLHLLNDI